MTSRTCLFLTMMWQIDFCILAFFPDIACPRCHHKAKLFLDAFQLCPGARCSLFAKGVTLLLCYLSQRFRAQFVQISKGRLFIDFGSFSLQAIDVDIDLAGEPFQLALVDLLRHLCKTSPAEKAKYLSVIFDWEDVAVSACIESSHLALHTSSQPQSALFPPRGSAFPVRINAAIPGVIPDCNPRGCPHLREAFDNPC